MSELFTHPAGLIGYGVTFLLVSVIWWSHNRLFATYFVPSRFGIILNFILLAFTVLFVFSIQLFIKLPSLQAYAFYAVLYAIVYLLLGTLYLLGTSQRRAVLSAEEIRFGMRRGIRACSISVGVLIAVAIMSYTGLHARSVYLIFGAPALGTFILMRVLDRVWPPLRKGVV